MAAEKILTQKLKRGGTARSPLPDTEFVGQAFARQIEKELRPLVKTSVSAIVLSYGILKVAEALRDVPVPAMLGVLELEKSTAQGLLVVDTDLCYHLVDLMLGGDPYVAPAPITRTFTPIDMALCRLPQEAIVGATTEALALAFGRPFGKQLDVVSQQQDVTQVRFAVQQVDVLVYTVALDIGPGARSGVLQLLLPLAMLDVVCAMMQKQVVAKEPTEQLRDLWKVQMRRAAALSPVVIEAVLHRQRMSIAEAMALKVGDVLEIPASATEEIQMLIAQPGGKRAQLGTARLGAFRDAKAIRLDAALDQRLRDQITQALGHRPSPAPGHEQQPALAAALPTDTSA